MPSPRDAALDLARSLTILKIPAGLRSTLALTKSYNCPVPGAKLQRTEYSAGMFFEYARAHVPTIQALAALHEKMMQVPHVCIIRGEPIPALNPHKAQRLLTNFPDVPRCILYVDYDTPILPRGEQGAVAARLLLPPEFHHAPCLWARTGSYGVDYEGRDPSQDPWSSRIRLGFMLDKPLDAPRLKRWLRGHHCDLAIYTANQITYTANPIFLDGAVDPVLAAGEARFGTLDLDDALLDEVLVPDDMFNWQPRNDAVAIASRPITIQDNRKALMLREATECDADDGERHGTVRQWIYDAFGLGMGEREIVAVAASTLTRLGRDATAARTEASRLLVGAQGKLKDGTLWVSRHHNPGQDFAPITAVDATDPPPLSPELIIAQQHDLASWVDRIKYMGSTRNPKSTLSNAAVILTNHERFRDNDDAPILAYDAFQDKAVWTSAPPWWANRPSNSITTMGPLGVPVSEDDYVACAVWLGQLPMGSVPIDITPLTCSNAINHVARLRTVNPAKSYLDICADAWDKVPRLATVLVDICHSGTDPKLLAKWFPNWMVQAVARIYHPGSKCDAVLVFQGGEGSKKSSFFRTLCPFPEWFLDELPSVHDKDSMQILRGKMIVELAEMFAARKSDIDKLKGFITKQDDTFRKSYGIDDSRRPRTCVFCASANEEDCLTDSAGRRWWVVTTPSERDIKLGRRIDLQAVEQFKAQWWGEAVTLYRAGHEWWLNSDDEKATRQVALAHSAGMEQSLAIHQWLSLPSNKGGPKHPHIVLPVDLFAGAMGRASSQWGPSSGREVAKLMKGVPGWEPVKFSIRDGINTKFFRAYVRAGSEMDIDFKSRNEYMRTHNQYAPDTSDLDPQ